ncbi:MAG: DUF2807 domain-containing protein [Bacteroidales bacterium]|nr:DUF2807 domain-containing protein [Candidatus Liminaster caballi]
MKNLILSITTALCALTCTANAETIEKNINIRDFCRIELNGSDKVIYTQGESYSVTVKAEKEDIDKVEISKEGETLYIQSKNSVNISRGFFDFIHDIMNGTVNDQNADITIYVTSPDLIGVSVVGSGDFKSNEKVDTDNLSITIKGSGDIDFNDIICDNVNVQLAGSGDVNIKSIESIIANYELRGSGDIKVNQQRVKATDLLVVGSGDIEVRCNDCELVNANVTGSGDIRIKGNIKNLNKNVRGSGDISVN